MPKLVIPTDRLFSVTVESKHADRRVTEDDPIIVSFRQATEALNLKRQELLARPISRQWDEENKYSEQFNLTPFAKRMAVDVWLTMTACNVEGPDGRKLFAFTQLNGSAKMIAKTLEDFLAVWGRLWPEWCEAIYEKCLVANPSWGFGTDDENEDEEALTLGEDVAGKPATEPQPDLAST